VPAARTLSEVRRPRRFLGRVVHAPAHVNGRIEPLRLEGRPGAAGRLTGDLGFHSAEEIRQL
jgi:hypothetical protein